jgi:hypothetical protein
MNFGWVPHNKRENVRGDENKEKKKKDEKKRGNMRRERRGEMWEEMRKSGRIMEQHM